MKNTAPDRLRPVSIVPGFTQYAEGSVLITCGATKVLCTASVEESVPPFLEDTGRGWVTAEYAMLPRSTHTRTKRERSNTGGRTSEIQRLIGRSLRAVVDMDALGPRTLTLDCDVLQADGGTRTASITGSYVALYQALAYLHQNGILETIPLTDSVAAISVGLVKGQIHLDLDYYHDCQADVDMNVVMTGNGQIVEIQGTAERKPFSKVQLDELLSIAEKGIQELTYIQQSVIQKLRS